MLVLTRKKHEVIVLEVNGEKIEIIMLGEDPNQRYQGIRIGIKAPPEVNIYREELRVVKWSTTGLLCKE